MPASADDHSANLLGSERSPYLRQHAHNPVAWQPWSDAAFDLARQRDVPVLVSIGYATCHWCHVMAHESFEDAEVASYLNDHYVCIKVDREERPDIDAIYMDVCQGMTGHGGWPLTIVTDADRRPFFAGTYFPRTSRGNRIGFLDLMQRIRSVWDDDRSRLTESATQITAALQQQARASMQADVPSDIFDIVADHHRRTFDDVYGGFNAQPKFPSPHHLLLLLRIARRQGAMDLLSMVTTTLDAMRAGGMYDHVGFGFHRYSTDREWLLPHFEKMLYDQAMLMMAYTEAWQITHDALYATVVDEIAQYIERCLTHPSGAFMSAQDADSDGEEGKCYVWSYDEFTELAGHDVAALLNVRVNGNFHDEATGDPQAVNIPHVRRDALRAATRDAAWLAARPLLLARREQRVQPITDDKILADWNGLMIGALAKAGRAFGHAHYTEMAQRAYAGVGAELGDATTLHHAHGVRAMLDDHAMLAWAATELYQSTGETSYLDDASRHAATILEEYADVDGSLFSVARATHDVIVRQKQSYDSAYPCGNSMAAWAFASLASLRNDPQMREHAARCVRAWGAMLRTHGPGACMLLCVWDMLVHGMHEIDLGGPHDDPMIVEARRLVGAAFLPDAVVLHHASDHVSVQWCTDHVCLRPLTTINEVRELLSEHAWEVPTA